MTTSARSATALAAGVVRVVVRQRRLAGDRLDDGDAVALGEGPDRPCSVGVVDTAARDQHRPLRAADQVGGPRHVTRIGAWAADVVLARLEEPDREVVGLRLHVLGQREERRTAGARVEHGRERLRQRLHDLGRLGDAVPVATDRLERVSDGDGRVAEVLDLLEDRIDDAVLERVARQQQHRQTVGVGDGRGGDHVGRPGPDR
jgi:hypothetical protein